MTAVKSGSQIEAEEPGRAGWERAACCVCASGWGAALHGLNKGRQSAGLIQGRMQIQLGTLTSMGKVWRQLPSPVGTVDWMLRDT